MFCFECSKSANNWGYTPPPQTTITTDHMTPIGWAAEIPLSPYFSLSAKCVKGSATYIINYTIKSAAHERRVVATSVKRKWFCYSVCFSSPAKPDQIRYIFSSFCKKNIHKPTLQKKLLMSLHSSNFSNVHTSTGAEQTSKRLGLSLSVGGQPISCLSWVTRNLS